MRISPSKVVFMLCLRSNEQLTKITHGFKLVSIVKQIDFQWKLILLDMKTNIICKLLLRTKLTLKHREKATRSVQKSLLHQHFSAATTLLLQQQNIVKKLHLDAITKHSQPIQDAQTELCPRCQFFLKSNYQQNKSTLNTSKAQSPIPWTLEKGDSLSCIWTQTSARQRHYSQATAAKTFTTARWG